MVLLGLATVSVANNWGNVLYGDYRWWFRLAGLAFLGAALVVYFRRRGVCTLDQARRERNRIINVTLLVLISAIAVYTLWTYVILHYWGIAAGLPWAQYDENWAIPTSAVMIGVAVLAFVLYRWRRTPAPPPDIMKSPT
jgi:NADH:ubiquinone oxidoreductase subunit 6 (subunit J)